MAGFKQVTMDLNPIAMYSFDGGHVSDKNNNFWDGVKDIVIVDETGNSNGVLALETDDTMCPGYYIGRGLVPLDKYEQASIRLCPQGAQPYAQQQGHSRWPKAYIIAPNCLEWDFRDKEFTYNFMIRKNYDANHDSKDEYYGYFNYDDIIFEHHGILTVGEYFGYVSTPYAWIELPALANTKVHVGLRLAKYNGFTGNATMITIRFKDLLLEVFQDAELIFSKDFNGIVDETTFSLETGSKQLTIGGCNIPKTASRVSDRCTRPTEIDQFTIWNRALTDIEIARLYRRIWGFNAMTLNDNPAIFHDFAQTEIKPDKVIKQLGNSGLTLNLSGNINEVNLKKRGPQANTTAMQFTGNSSLRVYYNSVSRHKMINTESDFTFMLSFKVDHGVKGVLFAQQSENPDYEGLSVWINSRNGQQVAGDLEMYLDNITRPISLGSSLSSSAWHNLVIRHSGNYYTVWLDGQVVVDDYYYVSHPQTYYSGVSLLASHINTSRISAYLTNLIVFDRALPEMKIAAYNDWESIYYIRGTVTMNGNPTSATVRVYNHENGQLIEHTTSNTATGVYLVHLLDNSAVDIVVLNRENTSVKMKGYGPILPYEMDDQPYNL